MNRLIPLLALVFCLAAPVAGAADWQAGKASSLGFRASYMGEAFEGRFARFSPSIRFDPDALAGARFDVRIALATADTDSSDRDEMLVGPDFFDAGRAPEARYVATSFRHLGGNEYLAQGELTLNGATRPVPLRFTWTPGSPAVLEGKATVKRLEFGVGEGDWADTELLPDEVEVFTRLELRPAA